MYKKYLVELLYIIWMGSEKEELKHYDIHIYQEITYMHIRK